MPVTSLLDRLRQTAVGALAPHMLAEDVLELDLFMSTIEIERERHDIIVVAMRVPLVWVSEDAPRSMSSRCSIMTSSVDVGTLFPDAIVEAWRGVREFRDFHNKTVGDLGEVDSELSRMLDGPQTERPGQ